MQRTIPIVTLLLACLAVAAGKSRDAQGPSLLEGDAIDLYVFQDDKPVRLRLHLQRKGVAYQIAWKEFIERLYDHLDVDRNGTLGTSELKELPTAQSLLSLARADYYGAAMAMPRPNARKTPELAMQLMPDRVTRAGLASYYKLSGMEPLLAFAESRGKMAEALNEVLVSRLDQDGDGKLSRKELESAERVLRSLDLNHDDALTPEELVPVRPEPMPRTSQQQMSGIQPLVESQKVVLFKPGEPTGRIGFLLINHYDKDQNQKLSADEIALPESIFLALDVNKNKSLDLNELAKLPELLPLAGELVIEPGRPVDLGEVLVRPLRSSELCWRLFTTGTESDQLMRTKEYYLGEFNRLDEKKVGNLESAILDKHNDLRALLPAADRNRDGKLTQDEMIGYLEVVERGIGGCVVLSALDLGRSWFDLLDTNQDGKLGIREWRSAWTAVQSLDQNKDDAISTDELAPLLHLQIGTGQAGTRVQLGSGNVQNHDVAASRQSSSRGPAWFRKMDRNADGYVSLREFLGLKSEFEQLDTDRDGFIGPEEAEKHPK